jgi:hypothetical protein
MVAQVGAAAVLHLGVEAAEEWWDHTTLVQRTAPLYIISLLPYLDFLFKLQVLPLLHGDLLDANRVNRVRNTRGDGEALERGTTWRTGRPRYGLQS